ncbi:MAG: sigma-54 dependent transcriptional regulator [Treponema sp.]|nr:sigma-54 dependent transcriptional regulator [Treponema sp.]
MSSIFTPSFSIAIVDDDEGVLDSVESALRVEGFDNLVAIREAGDLLPIIEGGGIGVVLLDIAMPVIGGMELLPRIAQEHPEIAIAMMTANSDVERVVECMRLGASDYLVKPVERTRLITTVRRLVEMEELERENTVLRERFLEPPGRRAAAFASIVTSGAALDSIMRYTEAIAPTSHSVLITGETGVGKELFARAVHDLGGRGGEFVPVNIAGLDDTFFSDLLFGHRTGAFTGASGTLEGLIERAKEGTLFLDEIGDLALQSQVKLLRLLETDEYYPLGSDILKRSRARIVVATNRDLGAAIETGEFRRDLYYRLQRHRIHIPPLRERLEDLSVLVEHFAATAGAELGKTPPLASPELFSLLRRYDFPGNVRELETMVFEAVNQHCSGPLPLGPFKAAIGNRIAASARGASKAAMFRLFESLPSLSEVSEFLVDEALRRSGGNQSAAARLLGISPQAVSKRVRARRFGCQD